MSRFCSVNFKEKSVFISVVCKYHVLQPLIERTLLLKETFDNSVNTGKVSRSSIKVNDTMRRWPCEFS